MTWTRAVRDGLSIAGLLVAGYVFLVLGPSFGGPGWDAQAYYDVDLANLYRGAPGDAGFFAYSPAAALLFAPVKVLPWPLFVTLWTGLLAGILVLLTRRWALAALAFLPVTLELFSGNINLLLTACVVFGFRYPALWAFPLLTKQTIGVGLLWFLARGEWRKLCMALGAAVGVSALAFAVAPSLWWEWIDMLRTSVVAPPSIANYVAVPLLPRLALAAAVVVWGARTDRYWAVPLAALIAMPVLWFNVFALLAGLYAVRDGPSQRPAARQPVTRFARAQRIAAAVRVPA